MKNARIVTFIKDNKIEQLDALMSFSCIFVWVTSGTLCIVVS